ncbi:MAG: GntR family transcriptional regulator [Oscillospiraceae bacterium]|jgi:GntR family transcriptional regulator of arabinose operon|nr:GntR family transcriptional regulator [Oscillospiraceae bacterium]
MDDFKYLAIVEWAKQTISQRGLTAGDRFFSETELCGIHNVSRQTVRQALALMENQGIIRRRQGSGTFVHVSAGGKREQALTVGLISTYFSDYIFPSIITGIERVLKKNNVNLQLSTTRNQVAEEARALRAMLAQGVDGFIVEPSKSALPNPNVALYDEIRARGMPLVFFNAKYPNSPFPCVAMDDAAAGRIATQHLLDCGHRKISAIFVLDDVQGHLRYKGFMESLTAAGAENPEERVMWFSTQDNRAGLFTVFRKRLLELLKDSSGIVCYNDSLAVRLLEFCREEGISVPGGISVVGIDDSNRAGICEVPLTTVKHPKQRLGEQAAELLLRMMENPNADAKDVMFAPELVQRVSVMNVQAVSELS